MDLIFVLTGIIAGFIVAFVISNLLNKSKSVPKSEYDSLNNIYSELKTKLILSEERLQTLQQEFANVKSKHLEDLEKINSMTAKTAEDNASLNALKETINSHNETIAKFTTDAVLLNAQINKLTGENSTLTANNNALNEKLNTQKTEILELQKNAQLQFEKIANQILEEKSGKFTEANRANIEQILKPLGENIETFRRKVEETYDKESKQRFSLEEKVKELVEQTNKVSSEANNLANALKVQTKKQGNWGEMILESILQYSGLEKDREYFLQQTIKDKEGNTLRPDVLVKLPGKRVIIIDSKVSLTAYDNYCSAESPEQQAAFLSRHLSSIYGHIDGLHNKNYDDLSDALDFTMMFIPIEPAYITAIQNDKNLWSYAYSKRILLISPTNIIACIKLMEDLWKRELQSKSAMEIVKRGEMIFEKLTSFFTTLEEHGKQLDKALGSYSTAMSQLKTGSGNLIGQTIKLKKLGLKTGKQIPDSLLPLEDESDDTNEQKLLN